MRISRLPAGMGSSFPEIGPEPGLQQSDRTDGSSAGRDSTATGRASVGTSGAATIMNPPVSVGLPVWNGGRYLRQAVDSVLSQTFTDFELILSDNASTDETERICREYAARDPRIRYYRSEVNRGAAWNFNRVVELARGTYFKWMAHDDVCAPDFLRRCVEVLERDPSVVVCYPRAADIDHNGRFRREKNFNLNVSDDRAHKRIHDLICVNHSCFEIFGVTRLAVLRRTSLLALYVHSDRVLLAELATRGRFHRVEEVLFLHREHPDRSTRALPELQARIAWFDPAQSGRLTFPNWRLFREYVCCVGRSGLPPRDRALCYLQLLPWLRRHYRLLWQDLGYAFRWGLGPRRKPVMGCRPGRAT